MLQQNRLEGRQQLHVEIEKVDRERHSECTRAQAVAFLFRYAASEAVTLQELVSGFSDADSVPGYALPAMNWALAEEIVQGNGSKLMPNDSCTRAQIVTFLFRAYQGK